MVTGRERFHKRMVGHTFLCDIGRNAPNDTLENVSHREVECVSYQPTETPNARPTGELYS